MIQQGILSFKIEITEEEITPRSGLVLYAEVLRSLKIREGDAVAFDIWGLVGAARQSRGP
jgi:hypothetical protein